MKANPDFLNLPLDFWAYIKLINQKIGYTERVSRRNLDPQALVPSLPDILRVFGDEGLDYSELIHNGEWTELGQKISNYFNYRKSALQQIQGNLMDKDRAKNLFQSILLDYPGYKCPMPLNTQTGEKKDFAYLTCITNLLIDRTLQEIGNNQGCDYDPHLLSSLVHDGKLLRVLSRRMDGAYPSTINPLAIWEIKEYYYTTTFGSRVSDGVYETQLDGWELKEIKQSFNIDIEHYFITDDYFTWWEKGKSYLCRIIDSLHMGLFTEAIFGREVMTRIPEIVKSWKK